MVADGFPIDQHFVNHPEELFGTSLDDLILDIDNEMILEGTVRCHHAVNALAYRRVNIQPISSVRRTKCLSWWRMKNGLVT